MQNIAFPINFSFNVTTLANDFVAHDASGVTIAYVRQKLLKLIDEITVFNNETKTQILFTIKANKWIDFSAAYNFTNASGLEVGKVARKGWTSLWKAHYEIFDNNSLQDLTIREENPWIKLADGLLGDIPILGFFTGYLFNPSYIVTRTDGTPLAKLKKEQSFLGKKFSIHKLNEFKKSEEERVILSLMMMILLERRRG